MTNPTIILIHGSGHCEAHYKSLIQSLGSKGCKVVFVNVPSTQTTDTPPASLADDTAAIRSAVLNELDINGNDAVVIAHSYGGYPTNNALSHLDTKTRTAAGHKTSVKGLGFLCSLPMPANTSMVTFFSQRMNLDEVIARSAQMTDPTGTWNLPKPSPQAEQSLYNDLPLQEALHWGSMLKAQAFKGMLEETSHAAYVDIPTGYLYTSNDLVMPLGGQQFIVEKAKEQGGNFVLEETVEAGHSPFLSQTEKTDEFIIKLVAMTTPL